MRRRRPSIGYTVIVFCLGCLAPDAARAQDKLDVLVTDLYKRSVALNARALNDMFPRPTVDGQLLDFNEELNNQLFTTVFTLNSLIAAQVSSFPLASSAGGFSWAFDSALGTLTRVSDSFGPVFAERALTVGRGRVNVAFAYQRTTFDSLQGRDLESGEIQTYSGLKLPDSSGAVRTMFFEDTLSLRLSADTALISGTYGLTDRMDVGAVVPFVRMRMDADLVTRAGSNGALVGTSFRDSASSTASGLGDIVARVKYRALPTAGGGLAVGVDWRLPTGDDEDLIGTGMQLKLYGAASTQTGRLSPHANFGYTVSREASAYTEFEPDQLNFAGGADFAVTPRLTVIADFVGRTLIDAPYPIYLPSEFRQDVQQLTVEWGYVNLFLGSAGVKFAPAGRGLVSFSVLFPLNDNGRQDKFSWMGGVELPF
jgi:hypothetical protein